MPRLLGAAVAAVLLVALALAVSRARDGGSGPAADGPSPTTSPSLAPPSSDDPLPPPDPEALLRDPDAAAAAPPEDVLGAGLAVARGDWADLGHPDWPPVERPVYIAAVEIHERERVSADVVVAFRASQPTDTLRLRLLAAASALTDVGGGPRVSVQRAGRAAPHQVDRAGALLNVQLDPPVGVGEAVSVRVQLAYELVARDAVVDDGGPAGFGLLAHNPEVSLLGHWLPLLTLPDNDGPMVPWGDVGAFPVAVWSVQVEHGDDVVVTGGADGPCPARVGTDGCTWARGTALRDVSAAVYAADATVTERSAGSVLVRSFGPPSVSATAVETALAESVTAVDLFAATFGPLAWTEYDVVAAPLSSGAAGMEFPGLVVIRDDTYGSLNGGFGTYVIAHEAAHQWFHALLGNGSLSDPVVDESLAQYASVLFYDAVFGTGAADDLVARYYTGRYDRWRSQGRADEPPAQRLEDFDGSGAYGPLVYARGALAWLAAEDAVGRDVVVAFLADLIATVGLDGVVTDDQVIEMAGDASPGLGEALARYWLDPAPVR